MRYDVFTLLGYILDAVTQNNSNVFVAFEDENVTIELKDINLINNSIFPLCENTNIAKIVFADGMISTITLEDNSGESFSNVVKDEIYDYVSDFGKDRIYCQICAEIIEYITFVLTT